MNKRLLLATTAAVAIATSAFAQSSPSTSSSNPPTTQRAGFHIHDDAVLFDHVHRRPPRPGRPQSFDEFGPDAASVLAGQSAAGHRPIPGHQHHAGADLDNSTNQAQTNQPPTDHYAFEPGADQSSVEHEHPDAERQSARLGHQSGAVADGQQFDQHGASSRTISRTRPIVRRTPT